MKRLISTILCFVIVFSLALVPYEAFAKIRTKSTMPSELHVEGRYIYNAKGEKVRLAGANIPILARILAVADVYDGLVAERSYKKAKTHEEAYNIITQGAGVQFDPQVVAAFQRVHMDIRDAAILIEKQMQQNIAMSQQVMNQQGNP